MQLNITITTIMHIIVEIGTDTYVAGNAYGESWGEKNWNIDEQILKYKVKK